MKIGLLTYHAACNYGANLQALSTLSYWRNNGDDPVFINWVSKELEEHYKRITPPVQFREHEIFRERFLPMTRRCYTDEDVASVIVEEGIEAIVVGSDAVMQTHPRRSRYVFPSRKIVSFIKIGEDRVCPNPFWGSFYHLLDKKIPMCFMSASCQNSPFKSSSRKERKMQNDMLSQFSYISTRDDWTSKQVAWLTYGRVRPLVTPDPVFAFNYNVRQQPTKAEICSRFGLADHYCLFCFHSNHAVSQQWLIEMQVQMSKRDIQCVAFPFPQGVEFSHPFEKQIDLPLSPLDWYAIIKYADYYIGENMHPIVICLHNAVPCFSFDLYGIVKFHYFVNEQSSKIYHIMRRFDCLENRVSLSGSYHEPTVDYVLERLDSFDKDKTRERAAMLLNEYKKMMHDINCAIKKNE